MNYGDEIFHSTLNFFTNIFNLQMYIFRRGILSQPLSSPFIYLKSFG